jgi:23S rRNA pseudouridine1911/1915/1917 synthase
MKNQIQILFEDEDILLIAKPAGMVTNRAKSVEGGTLQDWFAEHQAGKVFPDDWQSTLPDDFSLEYGSPEEIYEERQGMVHRLDKDTSGVMIFAKHPGSLINLLTQFGQHQVQKEYLALTHGKFRVERGTLNIPLARSQTNRQKFAADIEGRKAITQYQVEQTFTGLNWSALEEKVGENLKVIRDSQRLYEQGFSLVRCLPKTGRTHQIRVHLAHERHPIVGDIKYVGRKRAKVDPLWCPRQFLHAASLEFTHPRTKEKMKFETALPEDLLATIHLLDKI